jgi:hypothetical protein
LATLKFSLVAGLLIRGTIRRGLKLLAFSHDIDLEIEEERGLIESVFLIKGEGENEKTRQFIEAVKSWTLEFT